MPRAGSQKPVPPPTPKLSREEEVEQLLVANVRPSHAVKIIMQRHDVSERQVWDDIKAARDRWAKESAENRPQRRAEIEAQADDLYNRCVLAGDRKVAVQVLTLKADLQGARMRPMAAIVSPDAKPKDIDSWLSGALGLGTKAPEREDDDDKPADR